MIKRAYFTISRLLKMAYYKGEFGQRFKHGKKLRFRKGFLINIGEMGKVWLGNNVFFNNYCTINAHNSIVVGDNCIFGENVKIYDHNHKFREKAVPIYEQGYTTAEIVIGKDCWIGSNVVILKGAHIGNHVVIGAGCVIKENIPDDSIVSLNNNLIVQKIDV